MIERYETTRSRGEASLVLIFPEGAWESLPFEVRLLQPWYDGEAFTHTGISLHLRSQIATRGYCIAAAQPLKLKTHVKDYAGHLILTPQTELPPQQLRISRRSPAFRIRLPVFGQIRHRVRLLALTAFLRLKGWGMALGPQRPSSEGKGFWCAIRKGCRTDPCIIHRGYEAGIVKVVKMLLTTSVCETP